MLRDLRYKQERNKKKGVPRPPGVKVAELAALFPDISDTIIRNRLREKCDCVPQRVRLSSARCMLLFHVRYIFVWQLFQLVQFLTSQTPSYATGCSRSATACLKG